MELHVVCDEHVVHNFLIQIIRSAPRYQLACVDAIFRLLLLALLMLLSFVLLMLVLLLLF